ncbi:MAG: hypothetical protein AAB920_00190 [Patescibacteria group bacterium]
MSLESLERALVDKSISDEEFFDLLWKYCIDHDVEVEMSKWGYDSSIDSLDTRNQFGVRMVSERPNIVAIHSKHRLEELWHRCGFKNDIFQKEVCDGKHV